MEITAILLVGAALSVAQSTTAYGYRQVVNHNSLWAPYPANSYQFHYSNHGSNYNGRPTHGTPNLRWNHMLYSPMKSSWSNNAIRPQWQHKTPSSKWQNQMFKHKFRNTKSKHPNTIPQRPLGHAVPKQKSFSRANAAAQREWPEYIPPITMIKLPRDTPPDP